MLRIVFVIATAFWAVVIGGVGVVMHHTPVQYFGIIMFALCGAVLIVLLTEGAPPASRVQVLKRADFRRA